MPINPENLEGYYNMNGDEPPPEYAYHLEGQAIAVRQAQLAGRLAEYPKYFSGYVTVPEMDTDWYLLDNTKLFSGDCNKEILDQLKKGQRMRLIQCVEARPDIFDGRSLHPVAAILVEGDVLYCSLGFNLETYLASRIEKISPQPVPSPKPIPEPQIDWPESRIWKKMTKSQRKILSAKLLKPQ